MFTEAQNLLIIRTELDGVFFQKFDDQQAMPGRATANTGDLFKPVTITNGAYIYAVNKGVGLFDRVDELGSVQQDVPKVTNKATVYPAKFAKTIVLSKELFDDNMFGVWQREVENMAEKARITMDYTAFGIFRGAFSTTLTPDAVSMINASHTLIGGGTTSNRVTAALAGAATSALSTDALNAAVIMLSKQVDQTNVMRGSAPAILLVPPELFMKATQLVESALVPENGNNAVNVFSMKYQLRVYTSPFMSVQADGTGSASAWFLLGSNHSVSRLIRQGVETALVPWQFSDNVSYAYKANFRESYFVQDYVGIVGASGDAT
jgi:phage major head subunit gpT-like protein